MASCAPGPFPWRTRRPAKPTDRHVLAHVERERGFTHRRTPGDDDQVARLQARGARIEVAVAGRHAGDVGRILAVVQFLNAIDDLSEQRIDVLEARLAAETASAMANTRASASTPSNCFGSRPSGLSALPAISSPAVTSLRKIARSRGTISA